MNKIDVAKRGLLGGLGFMVIVAVTALIWRCLLLGNLYIDQQFFDFTSPTPLLVVQGLLTYFLTGFLLSVLFGHTSASSNGSASPVRFSVVTGLFYWVVHDLSYISRKSVPEPITFLGLEGLLVATQFGLLSVLLALVFAQKKTI